MTRIRTNAVELACDVFEAPGAGPTAEPLLLVMGLGAQRILWDDEFCRMLAAAGHRVVRFDNRDVGESTHLSDLRMPNIPAAMATAMSGGRVQAPYTLSDMAADVAGLIDALGFGSAHVVGASMGGMIAQTLAIEQPQKVRTLTSIMSTTGDPSLPSPTPEAMQVLLAAPPSDRECAIEHAVKVFGVIGSPGFPRDDERIRRVAALSYDRGFDPLGVGRQLGAVLASGDRTSRLAAVRAPTLVIHGRQDPLVPLEAGIATARAIPGARLVEIDGMGHDMPRQVWAQLVAEITTLTGAGGASTR